jgi:hypothetical protein
MDQSPCSGGKSGETHPGLRQVIGEMGRCAHILTTTGTTAHLPPRAASVHAPGLFAVLRSGQRSGLNALIGGE